MKLSTVWIVRDPGPRSTLADVCFSKPVERLGMYAVGAGALTWADEHHALYTTAAEAEADALERLAKRNATREPQ